MPLVACPVQRRPTLCPIPITSVTPPHRRTDAQTQRLAESLRACCWLRAREGEAREGGDALKEEADVEMRSQEGERERSALLLGQGLLSGWLRSDPSCSDHRACQHPGRVACQHQGRPHLREQHHSICVPLPCCHVKRRAPGSAASSVSTGHRTADAR
eukprot:1140931-Rhodomonas_salina.1